MRGAFRAGLIAILVVAACGDSYGENASTTEPSCTPACGPQGTCNGTACTCEPGYTGADCTSCAPGLQNQSKPGTCESACAVTSCGPHATCSLVNDQPVCACMPSYAKPLASSDAGADPKVCAWAGGPLDPGFQNMPAGAWVLEGTAKIDPSFPGTVNPGQLTFESNQSGRAYQSFAMPSFGDAEPLALVVSTSCSKTFQCKENRFEVGLNDRYFPFSYASTESHAQARTCLGERSYGGPLRLDFGPSLGFFGLGSTTGYDDVSVVAAPDCPAPGTIPNGNFDGLGGWEASGIGAEIAPTAGTGGSRAGHLAQAKRCDGAQLTGAISVPASSLASPALHMTVRGTTGKRLNIDSGYQVLGTVLGSGVFEAANLCLPQWSRGLALPLSFSINLGGSGSCDDPVNADFVIDDLAIVSDPLCVEPAVVIDGGFEHASNLSAWYADVSPLGYSWGYGSAAGAHSGNGFGYLYGGQTCTLTELTQTMTVPDAKPGKGGPRLRFWYRATGANAQFLSSAGTLTASDVWAPATTCLDPKRAGRPFGFGIGFQQATSACAYPTVSVDDVEIVHDPICPE